MKLFCVVGMECSVTTKWRIVEYVIRHIQLLNNFCEMQQYNIVLLLLLLLFFVYIYIERRLK